MSPATRLFAHLLSTLISSLLFQFLANIIPVLSSIFGLIDSLQDLTHVKLSSLWNMFGPFMPIGSSLFSRL